MIRKTGALLFVFVLVTTPGVFAEKGGNGKGDGGGGNGSGGGSEPCTATTSIPAGLQGVTVVVDTLFDTDPKIGDRNFNGYRIGSRAMDAVARATDILLAVSSSSSPNVDASENRLLILTYEPASGDWSFIQEIELDPADGSFDLGTNDGLKLVDWDDNGLYDVVIASIATDQAVVIWDVTDPSSTSVTSLPVPSDALTFGRSVGFGDVDGDNLLEVLVGDTGSDAVYVYHLDGSLPDLPDRLPSPAGGDFGQSIEFGSGGLYVGADAVDAGNRARQAGGVFHYQLPLDCGGGVCSPSSSPTFLTRALKNEGLGHRLALANSTDVVTTPGSSGHSIAVFPSGSIIADSLPVDTGFGLMDNVSAGDLGLSGIHEIATGTSNAGPDSGTCSNVGAVSLFVDNGLEPIILRSNDVIDRNNLFFGRSTAIAGGYLFVGEMGRDIDGDSIEDGQIYVFALERTDEVRTEQAR